MNKNLKDKVALITGASQGLGAYYAEVLANQGVQVVLSGRSKSLDKVAERINKK